MNRFLKNILLLIFILQTNIMFGQNANLNQTKEIVWTKVEDGFQIQLIRESNHEYILKTPLDLVNKIENTPITSYAGSVPYGEEYIIPEIQTSQLVKSRIEGMYVGMPLHFNNQVKKDVDRFLKSRRLIEESLGRANYFLPIADSVLATKPHLPVALKYLPMVESNYKPKGYSRVGARGIWQFMRGTGRMYGLQIDSRTDARLHPTKSTEAAFNYLEELYGIYGDWYLALASYNCGPGRVNRAIRSSGIENPTFWQIKDYLPKETRNYIPKFIAAVYVMHHADQIGLLPNWDEYEVVRKEVEDLYAIQFAPKDPKSLYAQKSSIPENATILTYTVKSGDNLGFIAEWYDVSAKEIRSWNGIAGNLIKPGEDLSIYIPAEKAHIYKEINTLSAERKRKDANNEIQSNQNLVASSVNTRNFVTYTIRNGDTLWDISRKNGVSLEEIKQLNNISNTRNLKPGMVIKIREKS